jgi:excisionase family DNA binding protein
MPISPAYQESVLKGEALMRLTHLPDQVASDERLLKAIEVQRILNLSRANVYRLMKAEVLPTVRIRGAVRVPYRDLLRWIELRTKPGDGPTG